MKTLTIREAQLHFEEYVAAAKRGEKIFIGPYGRPASTVAPKRKKNGPQQWRKKSK